MEFGVDGAEKKIDKYDFNSAFQTFIQKRNKPHLVDISLISGYELPRTIPTKKECSNNCVDEHNHVNHLQSDSREKPFQCSMCPKWYKSQDSLNRHYIIHTRKKPYNCGICSKSFAYKSHFIEHNMIHTGEKNFVCKVCFRSFYLLKRLRCHEKVHSDEKSHETVHLKDSQFQQMEFHTQEQSFSKDLSTSSCKVTQIESSDGDNCNIIEENIKAGLNTQEKNVKDDLNSQEDMKNEFNIYQESIKIEFTSDDVKDEDITLDVKPPLELIPGDSQLITEIENETITWETYQEITNTGDTYDKTNGVQDLQTKQEVDIGLDIKPFKLIPGYEDEIISKDKEMEIATIDIFNERKHLTGECSKNFASNQINVRTQENPLIESSEEMPLWCKIYSDSFRTEKDSKAHQKTSHTQNELFSRDLSTSINHFETVLIESFSKDYSNIHDSNIDEDVRDESNIYEEHKKIDSTIKNEADENITPDVKPLADFEIQQIDEILHEQKTQKITSTNNCDDINHLKGECSKNLDANRNNYVQDLQSEEKHFRSKDLSTNHSETVMIVSSIENELNTNGNDVKDDLTICKDDIKVEFFDRDSGDENLIQDVINPHLELIPGFNSQQITEIDETVSEDKNKKVHTEEMAFSEISEGIPFNSKMYSDTFNTGKKLKTCENNIHTQENQFFKDLSTNHFEAVLNKTSDEDEYNFVDVKNDLNVEDDFDIHEENIKVDFTSRDARDEDITLDIKPSPVTIRGIELQQVVEVDIATVPKEIEAVVTTTNISNDANYLKKERSENLVAENNCVQLEKTDEVIKQFRCRKCSKNFKSKELVQKHEKIHSEIKPFHCKICSKSFRTNSQLVIHKRVHTEERPFVCKICSHSFKLMRNLRRHKWIHSAEKPFVCKFCSKSFADKSYLKDHERIHTEKRFSCQFCSKIFHLWKTFKVHVKTHLEKGKHSYCCEICNKSFFSKESLKSHQKHFHRSKKLFSTDLSTNQYKPISIENSDEKYSSIHEVVIEDDLNIHEKDVKDDLNVQEVIKDDLKIHEENIKVEFISKDAGDESVTLDVKSSNHLPGIELQKVAEVNIATLSKEIEAEVTSTNICNDTNYLKKIYSENLVAENDCVQPGKTDERGKPFHCRICSKNFTRKDSLRRHEKIHSGTKPFHCKICSVSFRTNSQLVIHKRVHTGERPFVCKICSRSFKQQVHLRTHQRVHSGEKLFVCKFCSKSFADKGYLKDHERIHTEKRFSCQFCSKIFHLSKTFKVHMKTHLEKGKKSYCCEICTKSFYSKKGLRTHQKNIHTGKKVFSMDLSTNQYKPILIENSDEKYFNIHEVVIEDDLNIHEKDVKDDLNVQEVIKDNLKIHEENIKVEFISKDVGDENVTLDVKTNYSPGIKLQQVAEVDIETVSKEIEAVVTTTNISNDGNYLKKESSKNLVAENDCVQLEKTDQGIKQFHCRICSKNFKSKELVQKHEKIHSGIKPFHCKICSKSFRTNSQLVIHKRVHTEERPFVCKICSHSFKLMRNLRRHKLIHSGEKPFVCKFCSKSFADKSYLKDHERIHTEKRFSCQFCSKTFHLSKSFKIHVKNHLEKGKNSYCCKICTKSFFSVENLKTHQKYFHRGKKLSSMDLSTNQYKPISIENSDEKYFNINEVVIEDDLNIYEKDVKDDLNVQEVIKDNLKIHEENIKVEFISKDVGDENVTLDVKTNYSPGIELQQVAEVDIATVSKEIEAVVTTTNISNDANYLKKESSENLVAENNCVQLEKNDEGIKQFRCRICSKNFKSKELVQKHEKIHSGIKPFHCKICSKSFRTKSFLVKHKTVHTEERPFLCKICFRSFKLGDSLKKHEIIHSGKKPYVCKFCSKSFAGKSYLKDHERIHTEKRFSCQFCSKIFHLSKTFKVHMKTHLEKGKNSYCCEICTKSFFSEENLKTHQKYFHRGKKLFSMDLSTNQCKPISIENSDEKYSSIHEVVIEDDLNIHEKDVKDDSNVQEVIKDDLKIHEENIKVEFISKDVGDESVTLDVKSSNHLPESHLKLVTEDREMKPAFLNEKKKSHQCKICMKTFKNRHHLIEHQAVHSEEKPFQCIICSTSYKFEKALRAHQRKHHSEKRHDICSISHERS